MVISINGSVSNAIYPRYAGKTITIGIDSSKTNSALAIGDENCDLIDYIEMNGSQDGTTDEAVMILAHEERKALKVLLQGCKVKMVGIENIITKKSNRVAGMDVHKSRLKITAIFMSFISFFQDNYDVTPYLINNQAWKSHTIPEEYRTRDYDKCSKAYFQAIGSKYGSCTDDVTDSICILKYMKITYNDKVGVSIGEAEAKRKDYIFKYFTGNKILPDNVKKFIPNMNITLEENMICVANTLDKGLMGYFKYPTKDIPLEIVYSRGSGTFEKIEKEVIIVVQGR